MPRRILLNIAVIFVLLALPAQGFAYTVFMTELSGANVVPANAASSSGDVTMILNDAQTEVSYIVDIDTMQGNRETFALVQNAGPGQNGPVFLQLPKGMHKEGTWSVGPFEVQELMAGRVYVAIYTDLYPSGELRGNLGEPASPTQTSSWGSVKAIY